MLLVYDVARFVELQKSGVIADELPPGRQNFQRCKAEPPFRANLRFPSSAAIVACGA
jgi:hypothetical protein